MLARHCLHPEAEAVRQYLAGPTDARWQAFEARYTEALAARFAADRAPFDRLADLAMQGDVYIGCSCPTAKNPDVSRCHTVLALRFMARTYADLAVEIPACTG